MFFTVVGTRELLLEHHDTNSALLCSTVCAYQPHSAQFERAFPPPKYDPNYNDGSTGTEFNRAGTITSVRRRHRRFHWANGGEQTSPNSVQTIHGGNNGGSYDIRWFALKNREQERKNQQEECGVVKAAYILFVGANSKCVVNRKIRTGIEIGIGMS